MIFAFAVNDVESRARDELVVDLGTASPVDMGEHLAGAAVDVEQLGCEAAELIPHSHVSHDTFAVGGDLLLGQLLPGHLFVATVSTLELLRHEFLLVLGEFLPVLLYFGQAASGIRASEGGDTRDGDSSDSKGLEHLCLW